MSSFMEMSLEDIIRKKKGENMRSKGKPKGNLPLKKIPPKKAPIIDARNKIISKKRTQITDARDKLAQLAKQKDARLKLEQLRLKRVKQAMLPPRIAKDLLQSRGKYTKNVPIREKMLLSRERIFTDVSRQVVSQPLNRARLAAKQLTTSRQSHGVPRQLNTKRFLENRSIESRSLDARPRLKPILRTVENDLEMLDDPMGDDDDIVLPKHSLTSNRKANLQLRIVARNDASMRDSRGSARRLATPERVSPPRPPSILKKRPMASLRSEKKSDKPEKPALEYRIIVSNLRSTVTGGDIEELFGDIGNMMESRLVRPGTAEVIYKTLEDAQRAVELYHNRQLDGQPMNCLLVSPRATATPARNGSKPTLISSSSNVEPDISTFHKVLFSNF